MPTPNKYHSSGFLYGTMGYERGELTRNFISGPVDLYHFNRPYNIGRNADKRVCREQAKYWRSLHGRASITKGGRHMFVVDEAHIVSK